MKLRYLFLALIVSASVACKKKPKDDPSPKEPKKAINTSQITKTDSVSIK